MGFLLAVLGFIVAEEVVELEPVKASSTNVYKCNDITTQNACREDPYCYWQPVSGGKTAKCVDDPCLRYNANPSDDCTPSVGPLDDIELVTCAKRTLLSGYENHDCSGNSGSGSICAQSAVNHTLNYTYCEYTQLKDGSCPDSICKAGRNVKNCVKNDAVASDASPCSFLTESDCKLIPKCYWKSGNCEIDICFMKRPSVVECEHVRESALWLSSGVPIPIDDGTCTNFHPYSFIDGSVLDYCVHKDNSKANICYFGNLNITSGGSPSTDHGSDWSSNWRNGDGTYPTYNYGTGSSEANPACETDGLAHCEGHGECKTIVNQKGAFAGKYCTDGKHAAANILRIPSLLVFLVVVLSSVFSL